MKQILDGFSGWTLTTKSKDGVSWIELRKLYRLEPCFGNILIFVSNGNGYEYKNEVIKKDPKSGLYQQNTVGVNVRLSMNGPIALTFDDWDEINTVIQRCKKELMP